MQNTGELMQIARRAMATAPADRYASVGELQNAIRQYRTTGRAEELLAATRNSSDKASSYDQYQQSVALFTESRCVCGRMISERSPATVPLAKPLQDWHCAATTSIWDWKSSLIAPNRN